MEIRFALRGTLHLLLAPCCAGQEITATILGTVTDKYRGAIFGATITVTNTDQGLLVRRLTVPITDTEALERVGAPPFRPIQALPDSGRRFACRNSGVLDLYEREQRCQVIGSAPTHFPIAPERRPIVVWLKTHPHEIYLCFNVGG